ncbi:hypothetical protein [Streptomyces sp. NBC_01207]|uniref:hypothetical protein n=1 Tax=Streptomyces sp. NBC_01207 TaxID=2903772 RepID=UPI002E1189BE|nr:hypothetical protein OG457_42140 [Streptomyces sp. NBC_01207]
MSIAALPDGSAQLLLSYGTDGARYHCARGWDGAWTAWGRLAGYDGAPTFSGPALAITGSPDGAAHAVAVGLDGRIWYDVRRPDGSWTPFSRIPGPNGRDPFPAGQVRITALRDGSTHVTAISAGWTGRPAAWSAACWWAHQHAAGAANTRSHNSTDASSLA